MGIAYSIAINVDSEVVVAGQSVSGKIIVSASKKFRSSGSLELRLVGDERTKKQKRQVCQIFVNLARFTGKVDKGTYSYPFTIDLPSCLPSSMRHNHDFSIMYVLIAELGRVTEERQITVQSEPLRADQKLPLLVEPKSHSLKAAGMFDKGNITAGAKLENSYVGRGNKLSLHLACRNDSTAEIKRVEIKLLEEISWDKRNITSTRVHLEDVDLSGLDKLARTRRSVQISKASTEERNIHHEEIYSQLLTGESHLDIEVPTDTRDSYTGKLIKITHFLLITFKTSSMVKDAVIRMPIQVGNPPIDDISMENSHQMLDYGGSAPPLCEEMDCEIYHSNPYDQHINAPVDIPIVNAIILPEGTIEAPMAVVSADVAILGGEAIYRASGSAVNTAISDASLAQLQPLSPPSVIPPTVSLGCLLHEMSVSVSDFDILSDRLDRLEWRTFFMELSPDEYGIIIQQVRDQHDQPRVAALLAPYVNGGNNYTCEFAAAAVRNACEWNRAPIAQRLLPMCVDITTDYGLLRDELSEWDRTVTENDFQAAIRTSKRYLGSI